MVLLPLIPGSFFLYVILLLLYSIVILGVPCLSTTLSRGGTSLAIEGANEKSTTWLKDEKGDHHEYPEQLPDRA
ncbi:hypothetical protein GF1_09490 [Desulfolithobacter dissulfuricans]|uniref:Uncharacterized protein n=1 Tax=Desulfolithobacter dissulfuricans TaxID=2795293 RepID=A0A915TZ06_9BACT|nr:hypothetical protein GF1_09490 [Desulfolithobacter dissulfuricans]